MILTAASCHMLLVRMPPLMLGARARASYVNFRACGLCYVKLHVMNVGPEPFIQSSRAVGLWSITASKCRRRC